MADKKEYIERGALIEMLNNKAKTDHEMGLYNHGALTESFIRFVERQPAADVEEVRHGEWISIIDEPTPLREFALLSGYQCSECGRYEKEKQPYCNCGAKMDGGKEQA